MAIEEPPMNFGVLLAKLADGEALSECSTELQRLVGLIRDEAAVRNEPIKGKLVLTIDITVAQKGHADVGYDIKVAEPKKDRPETLMFLTPGNNLSDKQTKQTELPLVREAPRARTTEIDLNPGAKGAKEV